MIRHALAVVIALLPAIASAKVAEVAVGTRYTSFHYKEILTAPAKSTETVTYPSLLAEGRVFIAPKTFFQFSYEDAQKVNSNYDGASLTTGAPVTGTNPISFNTMELSGYFAVTDFLSLYAAYGMRKWNRFLSGGTGYREIYTWNYLSLGAQYWMALSPALDFGVDLCLRQPSGGKIKVITSETFSGGEDSTMNLGAKTGYRLALPFIWHVDRVSVTGAPFYEISKIGQSNVVTNATLAPTPGTGIQEPSSETVQYGVELTLAVGF